MPFLIGMPAQLLPSLKGIPMDEVTMIDLDLGRCGALPCSSFLGGCLGSCQSPNSRLGSQHNFCYC